MPELRRRISRGAGREVLPRANRGVPFYIPGLPSAAPAVHDDLFMVARDGENYSLPLSSIWAGYFIPDAVGDGVTDDLDAINAAVQAAYDAGGGVVFIPAGTYLIDGTIAPKNNVTIRGAGSAVTTLLMSLTSTSSPISGGTSIDIVEDFGVEHLTIDGQVQNRGISSALPGIHSYAFHRWNISDVVVKNMPGYGIGLQGVPYDVSAIKRGPQTDLHMERVRIIFCGNGKALTPTTLNGAVDADDATLTLTDASVLDSSGGTLQIDDEMMRYSSPVGNVVAVTFRGINGTTAASHSNGATVYRLANGDGIDVKQGHRFYLEDCYTENNGDKGFNIRCKFLTMVRCHDNGSVTAYDIGNISPSTDVDTTLSGALSSSATTINVASAASFSASGVARIDSEQVEYTGKTGTSLTGVTRGTNGTIAIAHDDGAGISQDALVHTHDTVATLFGCSAENGLSGFSCTAGGAGSITEINFIGCFARELRGGGFNLSGGTFGLSGGGKGQLRVKVIGGGAFDCDGVGIKVQNCESASLSGGFEVRGCGGDGIWLLDQSNGCLIDNVWVLANTGYGILEQGTSDNTRLGIFISRDNGSDLELRGANSVVLNYNLPLSGNSWYREVSGTVSWTPGLIPNGTISATKDVTVTGAALGAIAKATFTLALPDKCFLTASASSNTIHVNIVNMSGSDQTIGAGSLRAIAKRAMSST